MVASTLSPSPDSLGSIMEPRSRLVALGVVGVACPSRRVLGL